MDKDRLNKLLNDHEYDSDYWMKEVNRAIDQKKSINNLYNNDYYTTPEEDSSTIRKAYGWMVAIAVFAIFIGSMGSDDSKKTHRQSTKTTYSIPSHKPTYKFDITDHMQTIRDVEAQMKRSEDLLREINVQKFQIQSTPSYNYYDGVGNSGDVHVNGYYRRDGTYVRGHHRTRPNSTTRDNYSTNGISIIHDN